jgi:GxxExxY protein
MEKIIQCIKTVNDELGNHYKENIYQYALYVELNLKGFLVQTEVIIPILYKGVYVGFERADIVIYDPEFTYILELKSQNSRLSSKETNQLKKYLRNLNCEKGLLINFFETLEIMEVTKETSRKI